MLVALTLGIILEKSLSTAEKVTARRNRQLTPGHRNMLETVFRLTAQERKAVTK